MHDDPVGAPSLGTRWKELIVEHTRVLNTLGAFSSTLPRDDPEWRFTRVDSPPQVDDVFLVPFGSRPDWSGGGPSLRAFDAEGECLFHRRLLDSGHP